MRRSQERRHPQKSPHNNLLIMRDEEIILSTNLEDAHDKLGKLLDTQYFDLKELDNKLGDALKKVQDKDGESTPTVQEQKS